MGGLTEEEKGGGDRVGAGRGLKRWGRRLFVCICVAGSTGVQVPLSTLSCPNRSVRWVEATDSRWGSFGDYSGSGGWLWFRGT